MEKGNRLKNSDKQLIILIFTVFVLYILNYIKKVHIISKYNNFIFFIFYVIIGFVIPIFINKKNFKIHDKKLDKNNFKFIYSLSVGLSILIEVANYYINHSEYYVLVKSSYMSKFEMSNYINILTVYVFCVIIMFYFAEILYALHGRYSTIICILACSVTFAVLLSDDFLKNLFTGICIFYLWVAFKNIRLGTVFLWTSVFMSMLFEMVYLKISAFGLMHYFVFVMSVIGFLLFINSLKTLDKIMLYYEFRKITLTDIKRNEVKMLWFIILIVGIVIATYNWRF